MANEVSSRRGTFRIQGDIDMGDGFQTVSNRSSRFPGLVNEGHLWSHFMEQYRTLASEVLSSAHEWDIEDRSGPGSKCHGCEARVGFSLGVLVLLSLTQSLRSEGDMQGVYDGKRCCL